MRKTLAIPVLLICFSAASFARASALDDRSKLKVAAAQYEVIEILLKEKQYQKVLGGFREILDLRLKGDYERLVVEAAWKFAEELLEVGHYSIAEQIVEETLGQTEDPENRFILFMLLGKTLQSQGRAEEAIEIYRKAQQLEPLPPEE